MIFRPRPEKQELILLRYLKSRMKFSYEEALNYTNLVKGYEGELKSDTWLRGLTEEWVILNDLLLEYNGSIFQIDTLIIAYEKIYLLDIKNYEGDHSIKDDKWYTPSGKIEKNPLHQLERCETLLQRLLHDLGFNNIPIESYLIFINPEFHLYTTSIIPSIIFSSQLNRFLKKLNMRPVKLNKKHYQLAEQLNARHIEESPYERLPAYTYEQLGKGISCPKCMTFFSDDTMICKQCGCVEGVDEAVLRSVKEFALLFPDRMITVDSIFDWCGEIKSKKAIRRVLNKFFVLKGKARASHYVKS
jgi:hypothetical protein